MTNGSDDAPTDPTTQQELLRQWEERIDEAHGDPMAALAELLGARQAARNRLFGMAGEVVLGCRLEAILGAGGMGVTYDGVDANGERVAVKLVPGVAEAARPRFEQECRILAELQHPSIVRYRAHTVLEDGTGVLVMDLVRGSDLERVLLALASNDPFASGLPAVEALLHDIEERGASLRLSARYRRRVMRMFADVAAGLHAAHELGVVHRDVKPGNVLVRHDLSPVVIDFGLARDQQNRVSFTQSGIAMGTLAYMAPEQFGNDPGAVDRRADVYAVGLLLYRAMFGADYRKEVDDVLKRRRRAFLLDARQSREAAVDVQAILYRCLDPRPERRYATAKELEADLRAAAGQGAVKARVPSWPVRMLRDRRIVAAVSTFCFVAIVAIAVAAWPRGREVMFLANCGLLDAVAIVDGEQKVSLGAPKWLPFGVHEVELRGERVLPVRRTISVTDGPGAQWVTLITAMPGLHPDVNTRLREGFSLLAWSSGHQWNPIDVGLPRDQLAIDGKLVSSSVPGLNTSLQPGRYEIVATDGRGRTETQSVDLRNVPAVDMHMLPGVLASYGGSFRRTWSCVHSPLPSEFTIDTDAAKWTGLAQPTVVPMDVMSTPCAFSPAEPDADARLVLRCRFPEPMRSAFLYLRAGFDPGGELEVEAVLEGESAVPIRADAAGRIGRVVALHSERGASSLELRARMRTRSEPNVNVSLVRLFEGVAFGGHWQDEPPCFAVVADPAPRIGQAARKRTNRPESAPPLEVLLVDGFDPMGGNPSLSGFRTRGTAPFVLAWSSFTGAQRVLYEAPIDDLAHPRVLRPEAMHARLDPDDGHAFGLGVQHVPDQDGDGEPERIVTDTSSYARGTRFAGLIACFGSRDDRVLWQWPTIPSQGKHGDEGVFMSCDFVGDWNGDGAKDVAVGTCRTSAATGAHKAGYVAVLDARTGAELWSDAGTMRWEGLAILAVHECADTKDVVLFRHFNDSDTGGYVTHNWIWTTGAQPHFRHVGPLQPSPISGALIRSQRAARGAALVVGVMRSTPTSLGGFDRYELDASGPQLAAQVEFSAGISGPFWSSGMMSVGDCNGDGEEDVLFTVRAASKQVQVARDRGTPEPRCWCALVCGRTLEWLRYVELPGLHMGMGNWPDRLAFVPAAEGGGDAYFFCSVAPAALTDLKLFRIPIRPWK
jgi:hypothetical protein